MSVKYCCRLVPLLKRHLMCLSYYWAHNETQDILFSLLHNTKIASVLLPNSWMFINRERTGITQASCLPVQLAGAETLPSPHRKVSRKFKSTPHHTYLLLYSQTQHLSTSTRRLFSQLYANRAFSAFKALAQCLIPITVIKNIWIFEKKANCAGSNMLELYCSSLLLSTLNWQHLTSQKLKYLLVFPLSTQLSDRRTSWQRWGRFLPTTFFKVSHHLRWLQKSALKGRAAFSFSFLHVHLVQHKDVLEWLCDTVLLPLYPDNFSPLYKLLCKPR